MRRPDRRLFKKVRLSVVPLPHFMPYRHARDITSLVLLAPYLGDVEVINEISRAKGVRNWRSG